MACHEEHCYLLQVAIGRSAWGQRSQKNNGAFAKYTGWQALGKDVYNRMSTISDTLGDWMWHMAPWAEAAVQYGAARVIADLRRGDEESAALKAAFLSHYVVDPLAVSHAWLYLMGEIWEFDDDKTLHEVYHDPVEYPIGKHLHEVVLDPPVPPCPPSTGGRPAFSQLYTDCLKEAFVIGRHILEEFRGAKNFLPIVKTGVKNSARCLPAFFDDLHQGALSLADTDAVQWAGQRWMGRLFLDWPAERIRTQLFRPETIALLKKDMGYEGADVFFRPDRCSPDARHDYRLFQEAREAWRKRMGIEHRVKP